MTEAALNTNSSTYNNSHFRSLKHSPIVKYPTAAMLLQDGVARTNKLPYVQLLKFGS